MHTCVELGYIRGMMDMQPASGMVRKRDAEALLARNGFQKNMLQRWVSDGMVKEYRGEKNSPLRYSLSDIVETIGTIRYKNVIVKLQN